MLQILLNSSLKYSLLILVVGAFIIESCAQVGTASLDDNSVQISSQTQDISDDQSVENLRHYFESLKLVDVETVSGDTHEERLKSQDWLYQSYAETIDAIGFNKEKLLNVAGNDARVAKLINRYLIGEARFEDYLRLSEIAVIARVGHAVPNSPMTFAGPGFFKLDVSNNLLASPNIDNIVVINAYSSHMRSLQTGKECVFFLSPTRTTHVNSRGPIIPNFLAEDLPDKFLVDSSPTYCSSDGKTFSSQSQVGGLDEINREEILDLANAIPKIRGAKLSGERPSFGGSRH